MHNSNKRDKGKFYLTRRNTFGEKENEKTVSQQKLFTIFIQTIRDGTCACVEDHTLKYRTDDCTFGLKQKKNTHLILLLTYRTIQQAMKNAQS